MNQHLYRSSKKSSSTSNSSDSHTVLHTLCCKGNKSVINCFLVDFSHYSLATISSVKLVLIVINKFKNPSIISLGSRGFGLLNAFSVLLQNHLLRSILMLNNIRVAFQKSSFILPSFWLFLCW
jgi:hypothetical protein